MSRERLAVWSTVRHVASKAAPYAVDRQTQEAFSLVIAFAAERTEHFRQEVEPLPNPKTVNEIKLHRSYDCVTR
jgi:hypothetical protein